MGGYHVEFVQKLKAPDVPEMQFVIMFALDCDLNRTLTTNEFFPLRWRRVVNQDFTSHPCSSENLGVAEADVRSCKQLDLLTCIRPYKKLKVKAEDSEMLPKSLLK